MKKFHWPMAWKINLMKISENYKDKTTDWKIFNPVALWPASSMVHQCFAVSCRTLAFKAPLHPLILIPYKNNEQKILNIITYGIDNLRLHLLMLNPLSAHPTKWPNTLKQFVSKLPTNCGCVWPFCGIGA